jgi:hypothetical protein
MSLNVPIRASPEMEALYDFYPALWQSVRRWRTLTQINGEIQRLTMLIDKHPTSIGKEMAIVRNRRKLLFAKKVLLTRNQSILVDMNLDLPRNVFACLDAKPPPDKTYNPRPSVTYLMELSRFIGTQWTSQPEWVIRDEDMGKKKK